MIDEDKLKSKIEGLKSNLIHGACSSQIAMETRCKEEAYNEVLAIIGSMQEEHKLKPKFQEGNKIVYVGERKELDTDEHTILYVYDDMYVTTWGKKIPFKFQDDYQLVEEHVSEFLNTESMIESYKQRLISQANGMKNSPFIDMCLASYKHGINETLDTLKLSNVERTVKNWKEPVSEELEQAAVEAFKKIVDDGRNSFLEIFKAGAEWGKNQAKAEIQAQSIALAYGCPKESVSENLEEAAKHYLYSNILYDDVYVGNPTDKDCIEMFKAGAKWQNQQIMKNAVDGRIYKEWLTGRGSYTLHAVSNAIEGFNLMEKVKLIVIKEDKV